MATIKINFAYNEPRFGSLEITGEKEYLETEYDYYPQDDHSEFEQNMIDKIIETYPEAVDVEITSVEYFD